MSARPYGYEPVRVFLEKHPVLACVASLTLIAWEILFPMVLVVPLPIAIGILATEQGPARMKTWAARRACYWATRRQLVVQLFHCATRPASSAWSDCEGRVHSRRNPHCLTQPAASLSTPFTPG